MGIGTQEIIEENGLSLDTVMVLGIVKNISKTLRRDLEKIGKSLNFFKEVHWFLVESGSSDDSKSVLAELAIEKSNFKYLSIDISSDSEGSRTENLAKARNEYLKYIRGENRIGSYSYVIIADFNLLNSKVSEESILSSWSRTDWDVVTANQSGPYYDIWALRHPLWSPNDCWEHHSFLMQYIRVPEKAVSYSMRSRMLKIPKNSDWIRVVSAFGGLAIYKSKILNSAYVYDGTDANGKKICEHVPFHESLNEAGAKIFVNPAMINTKYTDHSRRTTIPFRLHRISLYPFKVFKKLLNKKII